MLKPALFVVFLRFLDRNPHAHDQGCVRKLDYVNVGLFIRDEAGIHLINMFLVGMMDNLKSCVTESAQ